MKLDFVKCLNDYNIPKTGIIQAGSHYAEELEQFIELGYKKIVMFEPNTDANIKAKEKIKLFPTKNIILYEMALGNETGTKEMFFETVNNSQSSSFLEPKEHLKYYPHIKFPTKKTFKITKLDSIIINKKDYSTLFLDCQGFELEIFKGATDVLKNINCIVTEINFVELYAGCALVEELDVYLEKFGFKRVQTGWIENGFTDAFYLKIQK